MFWSNSKFKGNIFVNVMVLKIWAILLLTSFFLKHLCFKNCSASVWNMAPYNPDKKYKNGVNAVICHAVSTLACWVNSGDPESLGYPSLSDACCLSVPFNPSEHSRQFWHGFVSALCCGCLLVLYPKLHRWFRIMVSLKNECWSKILLRI